MTHDRTCRRPRPYRAALDLWAVRLLTRLGLGISVRLFLWVVCCTVLAGILLFAAAIRAWGEAAVRNVRAETGYFEGAHGGLTNATHLVLLAAVPAIVYAGTAVAEILGLRGTDPGLRAIDRRIWQSLGLAPRHVVATHEFAVRLPILAWAATPLVCLAQVAALRPAEGTVAWSVLALVLAVEWLRLGAASARIRWTPDARTAHDTRLRHVAVAWTASLAAGLVLGLLLSSLAAVLAGRPTAGREVVPVAEYLASHPGTIALAVATAVVIGAVAVRGAILAAPGAAGFSRAPGRAPHQAHGDIGATLFFPVAGGRQVRAVWACADIRWAVLFIAAATAADPDWATLPVVVIRIVVLTSLMAFCLTRIVPLGLTASLVRLRHHAELGAAPTRQALRLLALVALSAAPALAATWWVLASSGLPIASSVGLALHVLIATAAADAVIAAPGGALTEHRLLLIALGQSVGCLGAWPLYTMHPAAGWVLTAFLLGGFIWMAERRQRSWIPRTPLPA